MHDFRHRNALVSIEQCQTDCTHYLPSTLQDTLIQSNCYVSKKYSPSLNLNTVGRVMWLSLSTVSLIHDNVSLKLAILEQSPLLSAQLIFTENCS
jgi:hypothetical protein